MDVDASSNTRTPLMTHHDTRHGCPHTRSEHDANSNECTPHARDTDTIHTPRPRTLWRCLFQQSLPKPRRHHSCCRTRRWLLVTYHGDNANSCSPSMELMLLLPLSSQPWPLLRPPDSTQTPQHASSPSERCGLLLQNLWPSDIAARRHNHRLLPRCHTPSFFSTAPHAAETGHGTAPHATTATIFFLVDTR
jgi:hypothetical protein